jgi:hypothetical protein
MGVPPAVALQFVVYVGSPGISRHVQASLGVPLQLPSSPFVVQESEGSGATAPRHWAYVPFI